MGVTARIVEVISFTDAGDVMAVRVREALSSHDVRLAPGHGPAKADLHSWTKTAFERADALVFVGAAGIAVRAIAAHVRDKAHDPAVVVLDEAGRWAIPLLSGHMGAANALARHLARALDVQAVITTATDTRGAWAVDEWARANGLAIENPAAVKRVSARLLAAKTVAICGPIDAGEGVDGVHLVEDPAEADILYGPLWPVDLVRGGALIVSDAVVTIGLGCRRAVALEAIEQAWEQVRDTPAGRVVHAAVADVATIDLKADEQAVINFCSLNGWRLSLHAAQELALVEGDFAHSDFVEHVTGVDNVCERAALAHGGRLLVPKTIVGPVTIALGLRPTRRLGLRYEECEGW